MGQGLRLELLRLTYASRSAFIIHEIDRAVCLKVDLPKTIINFLQTDMLAGAYDGDVNPIATAADAVIGGNV